jgi:S-DNA-T family DNA segregation ATPase FtsK/SpoIIIE
LDLSALFRLEVFGIMFLAAAVLTFLSFLSPNQGRFTDRWLFWLRQGFGWGAYVMPFVLGAIGLGLLMRGFGQLPPVRGERVIGLAMVLCMSLGLTHLVSGMAQSWTAVAEGRAGGLLGWAVGWGLEYAIGRLGGYVVAVALLIIGAVLVFGRSVAEIGLVLWMGWEWVRGQWQLWREERALQRLAREPDYTINHRAASRPRRASRLTEASPAASIKPVQARVIGGEEPKSAPAAPVRSSVSPPPAPVPSLGVASNVTWQLPDVRSVLEDWSQEELSQAEIQSRVQIIERTLESFGVPARVVEVNQGPVITQFGVEPGFVTGRGGKQTKVKVSRISGLADDLALALAASPIRIEAPVPGRSIVGIEVPNQEISVVSLRGVMESEAFEELRRKTPLPIALGENVSGEAIVANLVAMPHLLIAGATGSGKSVCINSIIACLLCVNTPDLLRMIMIDPKRVELTGYNGIPHLLSPVIVDLERVVGTLQWVTREMEQRYKRFAKVGARNIVDYNQRTVAGGQDRMPYIIVLIDELADLMMIAPDEVERNVCRIAQMARATGIHLIIATQRPSVDVVTGLIKANFPARISFMVTSSVDSRVIIDTVGAERLLGAGDMLFMSPDASQTMRLQGCWVSDPELDRLISHWKRTSGEQRTSPPPAGEFVQTPLPSLAEASQPTPDPLPGSGDEMVDKAIDLVRTEGKASTTLLQRRLRIGYARAARIIEVLEEQGLVGPDQGGSRGRDVLVTEDT